MSGHSKWSTVRHKRMEAMANAGREVLVADHCTECQHRGYCGCECCTDYDTEDPAYD